MNTNLLNGTAYYAGLLKTNNSMSRDEDVLFTLSQVWVSVFLCSIWEACLLLMKKTIGKLLFFASSKTEGRNDNVDEIGTANVDETGTTIDEASDREMLFSTGGSYQPSGDTVIRVAEEEVSNFESLTDQGGSVSEEYASAKASLGEDSDSDATTVVEVQLEAAAANQGLGPFLPDVEKPAAKQKVEDWLKSGVAMVGQENGV